MNTERAVELIHAEIDGRISEAERVELEAALADPDIRAMHDDLRLVATRLEALPELEPPAALRAAVRANLPASRANAAAEGWRFGDWLRSALSGPQTLRLAGAFAAGLAVGAVVINLGSHAPGMNLSELTGTMARYDTGADDAIDRLTMDLSGLAGSVGLHQRGALYVIEYDLNADEPIEVVTAYKGTDGAFNGFAHIGHVGARAVAEGRRVWLTVDGHRRYAIFLSPPQADTGEIEIGFYAGEELLHSGNLSVPAVTAAR